MFMHFFLGDLLLWGRLETGSFIVVCDCDHMPVLEKQSDDITWYGWY